tara:strand:+ start:124 stop:282 length:159 start_codon:yes stop_codon:yes gene_type:complete
MSRAVKFQDVITKVTFHKDTPEDVAVNIMSWVKNVQPVVLQKKGYFHTKGGK